MSTAPFFTGTVPYPGQHPDDPILWDTRPGRHWLGKPGNMIEVPSPLVDGYTKQLSGPTEVGLSGGGSGSWRFDSDTRRWTVPWARLAAWDLQTVEGFAAWLTAGPPPWCWVTPEEINRLTRAQSLCGAKHGAVTGWISDGGPPAYRPDVTANVAPCGVMGWAPGTAGKILAAGADGGTAGNPDPNFCAPYIPAMPTAWCIWVRTESGTASVRSRISGRLADATIDTQADGPIVAVTTDWQPAWVVAQPGTLGDSQFLVPELVSLDGVAVLASNPQLEYDDIPSDWGLGWGVPRVNWVGDRTHNVGALRQADVVATLVETITGAL